jgi:putative ABC transport system substrate-binding protein
MRLIGLAVIFAICALAPLVGEGQQAGKVYRVGILWYGPGTPPSIFQESLADAGYVEGTNVFFVHQWSTGQPGSFPELASELVRLKVDVLFATSTPAIRAAADATTTIPIVVISVGDPVAAGLITSLARPGGNITGLSARVQDLNEKLLELLKESTPGATRIAVMGGRDCGRTSPKGDGGRGTLSGSPSAIPGADESSGTRRGIRDCG